jgi:hypothetical protein
MLRTVFPLLRTNQMMVLDPEGQTRTWYISARDLRANTKHAGRTCCAGADQDKTRHKGFQSLEGLLLQGQAGKVGTTGTGRKGGHNMDRKEREERGGQ